MKKPTGPPRPSILEAKKRWKTWTRGVLSKEALKAEKDGTSWVTLNGVIHVILGFDFVFHVECFVHLGLSKRDFCFRAGFASKESREEAHKKKLLKPHLEPQMPGFAAD